MSDAFDLINQSGKAPEYVQPVLTPSPPLIATQPKASAVPLPTPIPVSAGAGASGAKAAVSDSDIRRAFARIDTDANGRLSKAEIIAFFKKHGTNQARRPFIC